MKSNIKPKVILIGAGPANIFAAIELIAQKVNPKEILIIEKGNSAYKRECPASESGCKHCKRCNIVYGFGGAGMFSDGKLEVDRAQKFDIRTATRVFEHMRQYGLELITKSDQKKVLERLSKVQELLEPYGLKIQDDFVSQHIGTNEIIEITRKIETFLVEQNVNILFNQEVSKIIKDNENDEYNVYTVNSKGESMIFTAEMLVVGMGKSSQHDFEKIFNEMEIENEQKPPIVGIRYEFPVEAMMTISNGILKDPLIYWKTPLGDEITTYCTCHKGRVIPYSTGEILLLGGHAMSDDVQSVTNFGLAFIGNSQKMYNTSEYAYSFAKLANAIGGNKPVIQTYGDFLDNTLDDKDKHHRTALKNYVYGNLNFILPKAVAEAISSFIEKISHIDSRFKNRDNILSAPIIEFVSPKVKIDNNFESSNSNLFFSGETSGKTYGIVTSAGSGIQIAEVIAGRLLK